MSSILLIFLVHCIIIKVMYYAKGDCLMATDKNRYTVSVDDDLFDKIENFKFEHRFQTRSEATVKLLQLGVASLNENDPNNLNIGNEPKIDSKIATALERNPQLTRLVKIIISLPAEKRKEALKAMNVLAELAINK